MFQPIQNQTTHLDGLCEYIGVYVDDIHIATKDHDKVIKALQEVHTISAVIIFVTKTKFYVMDQESTSQR
jgi:hypothetical protein